MVLGVIAEADFNKNITLLAYVYGLNCFVDDCLLMLLNTTDNYFQRLAVDQFTDKEFFAKCVLIFEILSHVGYAPHDLMCTQKEAIA